MMKIVLDAGYHGYVGIEYEGHQAVRAAGHPGHQKAAGKGAREAFLIAIRTAYIRLSRNYAKIQLSSMRQLLAAS